MTPVWLVAGSLSLGLPRAVLRVLVPLKCTWMPLPLHSLLNFSAVLLMYGTTMVCFVVVVASRVVVGGGGVGRSCWLWGLGELVFPLVQCPRGELAVVEGCFDM